MNIKNYDYDYFEIKGLFLFGYINNEIQVATKDTYFSTYLPKERIIGDLLTGLEFYDDVDGGGIIDYDGHIRNIFVNGYKSNLGLCHKGLCQGEFIVDGPTWLDICDQFEVTVEWCNK